MRLINIRAFLERERMMSEGKKVDRRIKVLESHGDKPTPYAILSHRWTAFEVGYEEMVSLAKMDEEHRDEIREYPGYKKIQATCQQAESDGYGWVWVDTCCINNKNSTELSEAINSMYRWYKNSEVCYAYLHDVSGSSFPTKPNTTAYPKFGGWPEWFSRGWTLQEMIAPSIVQFFNENWQPIGDKQTIARTLAQITRVPEHILTGGLQSGNRPCVAQIVSWAANRTTSQEEDRAYSLMGLLDVNMPMLYGEGKKAFHRLQLELIRVSSDQSIFAWGHDAKNVRPGNILADDPSFFEGCSKMIPMDYDEFLKLYPNYEKARDDTSRAFLITNNGIQICMPLGVYFLENEDSSVAKALLPCYSGPNATEQVSINLIGKNDSDSTYYRYSSVSPLVLDAGSVKFCQVYLQYQDMRNDNVTFEIDDSTIIENGFTCSNMSFQERTGNSLESLTASTSPSCQVKVYTNGGVRFAVAFGQYFGQDWVHVIKSPPAVLDMKDLMFRGQELIPFMRHVPLLRGRTPMEHDCIWVHQFGLPGSTWIVETSRMTKLTKTNIRIRIIETFLDSDFHHGSLVDEQWKICYAPPM